MRLVKLIGLEVEALLDEHERTLANIARYEDLLNNYDAMADDIMQDLEKIKNEFGRPRRTALTVEGAAEYVEQEEEAREIVFLMDRFGYARTVEKPLYEKNKETLDAEARYVFPVMSDSRICLFTEAGKLHTLKAADLPNTKLRDKGIPVDNVTNFRTQEETIIGVMSREEMIRSELLFATKDGFVKRCQGAELDSNNRTVLATKVGDGDALVFAGRSDEMEYVVRSSSDDHYIRFEKAEIPVQKKNAAGVRGMKLGAKASVQEAYLLENGSAFAVEKNGRQILLNRLKLSKRGGQGTKNR